MIPRHEQDGISVPGDTPRGARALAARADSFAPAAPPPPGYAEWKLAQKDNTVRAIQVTKKRCWERRAKMEAMKQDKAHRQAMN